MSDYTLEQKLAILEKMKQEQAKNEFSVRQRKPKDYDIDNISSGVSATGTESRTTRSFGKLRFLFALFLLAGYFFLHFTGFSYKTFRSETIESFISDDFSLKEAEDFLKNIAKNFNFL